MQGGLYSTNTGSYINLGDSLKTLTDKFNKEGVTLTPSSILKGEYLFTLVHKNQKVGVVFLRGENLDISVAYKFEVTHSLWLVPYLTFKRRAYVLSIKRANLVTLTGEQFTYRYLPNHIKHRQINTAENRLFIFKDLSDYTTKEDGSSPVYQAGYAKGIIGYSFVSIT